jgi:hypothetical protein
MMTIDSDRGKIAVVLGIVCSELRGIMTQPLWME